MLFRAVKMPGAPPRPLSHSDTGVSERTASCPVTADRCVVCRCLCRWCRVMCDKLYSCDTVYASKTHDRSLKTNLDTEPRLL